MDALLKSNFEHYENNEEYRQCKLQLLYAKVLELSITDNLKAIRIFQIYNDRRLAIEEEMENRVAKINQEIELSHVDKCVNFYLKQKQALEAAYTEENSVKQQILRENRAPCPFGSNDGNDRSENDIQAKIQGFIKSNFGHYQNNIEYNNVLRALIRAGQSGKSFSVNENVIENFQQYNNQRLILEEKIKQRVTEINNEIELNHVGDECKEFFSKQKVALEAAYVRENFIKEQVLEENGAYCPFMNKGIFHKCTVLCYKGCINNPEEYYGRDIGGNINNKNNA